MSEHLNNAGKVSEQGLNCSSFPAINDFALNCINIYTSHMVQKKNLLLETPVNESFMQHLLSRIKATVYLSL